MAKTIDKDIFFLQYLHDEKNYGKITDYCETIVDYCKKSNTDFLKRVKVPDTVMDMELDVNICDKVKEIIQLSYSFSTKRSEKPLLNPEIANIDKYWYCQHCETQNSQITSQQSCKECGVLKQIELYPSFFHNCKYLNFRDSVLLPRRIKKEVAQISSENLLQKEYLSKSFYLISEPWMSKWESYAYKPQKEYSLQTRQDFSEINQVPHPAPINNSELLCAYENKDDKFEDYRLVNGQVWNSLWQIYGGGPVIQRKKGHLFAEEVEYDATQVMFQLKVQSIKEKRDTESHQHSKVNLP